MHGVGSSVVNALSNRLEATVHKHGKIHYQKYLQGVPVADVTEIGDTDHNGTTITFMPDTSIFETVEFSSTILLQRMKQAAYLTPKVTFTFINAQENIYQRFYFEQGIKTRLASLVDNQQTLSSPHYFQLE